MRSFFPEKKNNTFNVLLVFLSQYFGLSREKPHKQMRYVLYSTIATICPQ